MNVALPLSLDAYAEEKIIAYQQQHPEALLLIVSRGQVLPYAVDQCSAAGVHIDCSDALVISVLENTVVKKPLHIVYLLAAGEHPAKTATQRIILAAGSALTVVEAFLSAAIQDHVVDYHETTHVLLQENASIQYYKTQDVLVAHRLMTHLTIEQAADSHARLLHLLQSSLLARHRVTVNLHGAHASCYASGFARTTHDHHCIDQQIEINHLGPHSQSHLCYKGLLDKKSQMHFHGRVYVAKAAEHIVAYQENHHLLLSQIAEVYTKPELEIYADDITCKHGATVGELDEEALFYLQSRGILFNDAVVLLVQGFASDIFKNIRLPSLLQTIATEVGDVL